MAGPVDAYLASLPEDRRAAISAVRDVILKNLDPDFEEGISYGMISYCVPHRLYPAGYHCDPKQALPFIVMGSKKNYVSLHMMSLYSAGDPESPGGRMTEWFSKEWAKTGRKLDMGQACIRFKRAEDVALKVIGAAVKKMPASRWIEINQKYIKK